MKFNEAIMKYTNSFLLGVYFGMAVSIPTLSLIYWLVHKKGFALCQ